MKIYHVKGDIDVKFHVSFDTRYEPGSKTFYCVLDEMIDKGRFEWSIVHDLSGLVIEDGKWWTI